MWKNLLLLTLFLALSRPAGAELFSCAPASRPYLEVRSYVQRSLGPKFPFVFHEIRSGYLLCRDRRVIRADVETVLGGSLPTAVHVLKGRMHEPAWDVLVQAVQAVHIGFLQSCRLEHSSPRLPHQATVTWFGAGSRSNTFSLSSEDPLPLSLPVCAPEVNRLWDALALIPLEAGAEVVEIR